jgi:glutamate N-acetyltransferase / amino-acid N-acetyltransferase
LEIPGFRFAAVNAGIKKRKLDMGLLVSDVPAVAAGVFTANRFRAAPVVLSEERLRRGSCQVIVVNSGCANACTGRNGVRNARRMAALAAEALRVPERLVCVASTGVIGRPLPMDRVAAAVPVLAQGLDPSGLPDFARAILTTDRGPKVASGRVRVASTPVRVAGVAKGAGMIAPNLATMLAFVVTDAVCDAAFLRRVLAEAVDKTFNAITVDGDTSTNDSVFLLASGRAGNAPLRADDRAGRRFRALCCEVMRELALGIVADGEGATRVVEIAVRGQSREAARAVARRIAESPLVKTAIYGADPNWGRLVCAVGNSGQSFEPRRVAVDIGPVAVVRRGVGVPGSERRAAEIMRRPRYRIAVDLGSGTARAVAYTCDLTHEYVRINAAYRS